MLFKNNRPIDEKEKVKKEKVKKEKVKKMKAEKIKAKKVKVINKEPKKSKRLKKERKTERNHKRTIKTAQVSENSTIVAEFITEEFRFLKTFESAINKLFPEERKKYISAYNYHIKKINEIAETVKLGIWNFEGKDFDEGLAVVPLNLDEFDKEDELYIYQTIEPTITHTLDGSIIKSGSIMLAKKAPTQKENGKLQELTIENIDKQSGGNK